MLAILTILVMLLVGYAYFNEDLPTAFAAFFNVLLAGLIAFNFWEPIADLLDAQLQGSPLRGYEDALCLVFLFSLALGLLRLAVNNLSPTIVEFPMVVQKGGATLFGLATGYLIAGFLLCVFQTLPAGRNFMGFEPEFSTTHGFRRILPPDRVWLGLMHRAGAYMLESRGLRPDDADTFDKHGSFELRYARYRRRDAKDQVLIYKGESNPRRPLDPPMESGDPLPNIN